MVFGMVAIAAEFTHHWGSAAHTVVAELEASLTVGGRVLYDVFPEGTSCSVKGQEGVGLPTCRGDQVICVNGQND